MKSQVSKLAYTKRAKPVIRDSVLMSVEQEFHPLVEKAARAISDWHSEGDWMLHTDRAIRTIEAIAEHLGREGHRDAKAYLHSVLWKEPKPRQASLAQNQARLFF